MPLEISVTEMKKERDGCRETEWVYDPYTVYVGDHRILTIFSQCYQTTTKWFKDVHKSPPNNYKHGCILVGVCAGHDPDRLEYDVRLQKHLGPEVSPYHLLQISLGSHCFLYHFPSSCDREPVPKALQAFFEDPRVIAVGTKMKSLAKKLETDHGIRFANPVDLNELAEKGMMRHDLDLGRYDLDRLAKAVLGKHWDVDRPEGYVPWFYSWYWWREGLSVEKVEIATVDPFLCYMIGNELLDRMDDEWYPMEFRRFLKMNKKYKKKKGKEKKKFL